MSTNRKQKLEGLLRDTLGYVELDDLQADKVVIQSADHQFTFDDMAKLSEMFGTNNINIGSESRTYGYCETCGGEEQLTVLTVYKITKWPEGCE